MTSDAAWTDEIHRLAERNRSLGRRIDEISTERRTWEAIAQRHIDEALRLEAVIGRMDTAMERLHAQILVLTGVEIAAKRVWSAWCHPDPAEREATLTDRMNQLGNALSAAAKNA